MNAISLTNLTKCYGTNRGITRLNLNIEQGEFFGFIGPNGAGKSTTIRLLLGLIRPTEGQAHIFGHDTWKEHVACVQDLGYLPSETHFYAGQTVRDVLRLSAHLHHADCEQQAKYLCEQLQLDPTRKVDELSFGNRKKVGIVAALQHRPRLLILDEPTGGLDPLMQHTFFRLLKEYNQAGTTIFFSSHILSEVQNNCTRAAIIRDSEIVACDSVQALMKTNAKKVTVRGQVDLSHLEGIAQLQTIDDTCHFLYQGDLQLLLRCLEAGKVKDLSIDEPGLEDIFMHYYK
ncbi:MAG: ATP-binding cassette domain-containing protein [Paludibacteraceae bacterium]